jgi:hypothetical protein
MIFMACIDVLLLHEQLRGASRLWLKKLPLQNFRVFAVLSERTAASVGEFAAAMPAHEAKPDQVRLAAVESINSIIQTARHHARGFRNFENLKAICYWMVGRLDL